MPRFVHLNNVLLFLCWSIYLGTGVSLIFFQLPLEPKLTIDNYRLIFVEPVAAATHFFTYMTIVMLATGALMLATEFFSGLRWVPVVSLLAIIASTVLTLYWIIPLNDQLALGVVNSEDLHVIFAKWASLNRIRASLWVIGWCALMSYFYSLAVQARADR